MEVLNRFLKSVLRLLVAIAVLPYSNIYKRNTHDPLKSILEQDNDDTAAVELQQWASRKFREAQYVQVAGAVLFASTIASLSWPSLDGIHWSGPALWYAAIVFSLNAVILGAQQAMVVSDIGNAPRQGSERLGKGSKFKKRNMLFVWQAPIMSLAHSVIFFLVGLISVVVSPFSKERGWNDEAKTMVVFLVAVAFSGFTLLLTSSSMYSLAGV